MSFTKAASLPVIKRFADFRDELQVQWKRDRKLRQHVPIEESWRGCMGLAFLLDGTAPIPSAEHLLLENSHIRWMVLRDIPAGQFPANRRLNGREVNYVNQAKAELRYGAPVIDFRNQEPAWDFRFIPFGRHLRPRQLGERQFLDEVRPAGLILDAEQRRREFAVLNQLSAAMTDFAFSGVDHQRRPFRPAWARRRPRGFALKQPENPADCLPRAYVAFTVQEAERLYAAVTDPASEETAFDCPRCHAVTDLTTFSTSIACDTRVLEDGAFAATCPACRQRRKWFLSDGRPCRTHRRFTWPFRDAFLADLQKGMEFVAIGYEKLEGEVVGPRTPQGDVTGQHLDLTPYRISRHDGTSRLVFLPSFARVHKPQHVKSAGMDFKPGHCWATLPVPPAKWLKLDRRNQWNTLYEVLGGRDMVGHIQKLWFDQQALCLPHLPGTLLYPAELVAPAAKALPPRGLWWDISPAELHYDPTLEATVLPPLRLRHWDSLSLALPNETLLQADVPDRKPRHAVAAGRTH